MSKNQMEEEFDLFSKLIKRNKPSVPDHFFSDFRSNYLSDSNKEETEKIELKLQSKPTVPKDFFQKFHSNLIAEIDNNTVFADLNLSKSVQPNVPPNFNEQFKHDLLLKIKNKPKGGRILKISFWSAGAAIAAGLTLLLTLSPNETAPVMETPIAKEVSDEESLDTYATYMDEESLIDYIVENDVDLGEEDSDEDVYDYVNSDIEDIYLDLD